MKKNVKKIIVPLASALGLSAIIAPFAVSCVGGTISEDNPSQPNVPQKPTLNLTSVKIESNNTKVVAGDSITLKAITNLDGNSGTNITYRWEIQYANTKNNWLPYDEVGQVMEITKSNMLMDGAKVRVVANYEKQQVTSSAITLNITQSKPIEQISIIPSKKVFRSGDELVAYTDVAINDYAITNISNINYQWEMQGPGCESWEKIPDQNFSVLSNFIVQKDFDNCKLRVTSQYNGFNESSSPIIIDVNDNEPQPLPDPEPGSKPIKPATPSNPNQITGYSLDEVANDSITSFGVFNRTEVETKPRPVAPSYYETNAWTQYHDSYGFVYPGWNRNYKWHNDDNRFFTNSTGHKIDGNQICMDERVASEYGGGNDIKFNNSDWIKKQIEANTFKKHHAADNFYANDISNIPITTMDFEITTASTGHMALGLYAPPGEVVTLTFDDDTWNLIKSNNWRDFDVTINQNFWDNYAFSDSGRISNRYPYIRSWFKIDLNNNEHQIKFGSPFGGGIGIRIPWTINKGNGFPTDNVAQNIKFRVDGAIKCMYYQDGVTTEADWENQKQLMQENKIAPILQAVAPYASLTIPSTNKNEIGHCFVGNLLYPKESFKKWDDFLYLSNFYSGSNGLHRLDMQYCDDVWGGAGAWGGGMTFYCPTNWGVDNIFRDKPINVFNSGNAWGVFHEINHNFEQNSAFFKKRGHGETNQTTGFDLSVISDAGRYRSEMNYSGEQNRDNNALGWSRLNNPYIAIKDVIRSGQVDEYPIYAILLFTFGSKAYVDYLRDDVANDSNEWGGWSGFKEIVRLSKWFKINLWPTFFAYGRDHWVDSWPTTKESITKEQETQINELETKFPAVDFVSNQYAAGIYKYDCENDTYIYTDDVVNPYEITAGSPYTFYFDDFIVSTNPDFTWDKLLFSPTTKLGGSLKYDETNHKRLVYTPPANNIAGIDEFDLSIIPGNWKGKSSNYVPTIKWKIKVRQVVNEPVVEFFEPFEDQNANLSTLFNKFDEISKYKYRLPLISFNTNLFNDGLKRGIKINYDFVAPEDGNYSFVNIWDDGLRMKINGNPVNVEHQDSCRQDWTETYRTTLKKGEVVKFEFKVINIGGPGKFNAGVKLNDEWLNFYDHVLIPDYENVTTGETPLQVLANKDYQYKTRLINREIFNKDSSQFLNFSDYKTNLVENSDYRLEAVTPNTQSIINNFNDYGSNGEYWGGNELKFNVIFNNLTDVKTLYFGHRTDNHGDFRPTNITVKGFDNSTDYLGYDILNDIEYPNRGSSFSGIVLDHVYKVNKLEITLSRKNRNDRGIVMKWFKMSPDKYVPTGSSTPVNNPHFYPGGDWAYRYNDNLNYSQYNNIYAVSTSDNDYLEITYKNMEGFAIVGQKNAVGSEFEVFVNGQSVGTGNAKSDQTLYNQCLFNIQFDKPQTVTIKIKHNDKNPLFINYIKTFGKDVHVS